MADMADGPFVFLTGMRTRQSVFASWVQAYFTRQTRARIILGADADAPLRHRMGGIP